MSALSEIASAILDGAMIERSQVCADRELVVSHNVQSKMHVMWLVSASAHGCCNVCSEHLPQVCFALMPQVGEETLRQLLGDPDSPDSR